MQYAAAVLHDDARTATTGIQPFRGDEYSGLEQFLVEFYVGRERRVVGRSVRVGGGGVGCGTGGNDKTHGFLRSVVHSTSYIVERQAGKSTLFDGWGYL